MRSRAKNALKTLGSLDEKQLPEFIRPVKNVIHKAEKLFNDVKSDIMNFYNVSFIQIIACIL